MLMAGSSENFLNKNDQFGANTQLYIVDRPSHTSPRYVAAYGKPPSGGTDLRFPRCVDLSLP